MDPFTTAAIISGGSKLLGHLFGGGDRKRQKKAYKALKNLGSDISAWDPVQYGKDATQAQFESIQSPLTEAIADYRAGQTDMDRVKTGFSFEGEDRITRDVYKDLNTQIVGRSLEMGGMNLSKFGLLGDVYGSMYDIGARGEQSKANLFGGLGRDVADYAFLKKILGG